MLDQGRTYLAYSGDVPRDSSRALLLRRAWESLRRDREFQKDCKFLTSRQPSPDLERLKAQFRLKWGLLIYDWRKSFDDIVGTKATLRLDDPDMFDDVCLRLYGDTIYDEDTVVQCNAYNKLHGLLTPGDFERVSALARGHSVIRAPLETLQDIQPSIQLTIDVDQNLIAILYKVKLIIQALRKARVQAGNAKEYSDRIKQQLATLEEQLDSDIVGDGRRDFRQDKEEFRIWDLSDEGKTDDEIARVVWPALHGQDGGVRDSAGRTKVGRRVDNYRKKAKKRIELYKRRIKNERVTFPPT